MIRAARALVVGSDPGLMRLRMAVRTTASLVVTLVLLLVVTSLLGVAFTNALIGVVIAMLISMSVNDQDVKARLATSALVPVAAGGAVTLAALLAGQMIAQDVVFLVVMVIAVLLRVFGPRGTALGMAAFMTYFFALFLGATLAQLPLLLIAVVAGVLVTFLIRTYVLPDRPERSLRLTLEALLVRSAGLVDAVVRTVAAPSDARARRRLVRRANALGRTLRMIEDQFEQGGRGTLTGIAVGPLEDALSDVRLTAERLVRYAIRLADVDDVSAPTDPLLTELRSLRRYLNSGPDAVRPPRDSADGTDPEPTVAVRQATAAFGETTERVRALLHGAPSGERTESAPAEPDQDEEAQPTLRERLRMQVPSAAQVVIAGALAIVGGSLLSSSRWYWAVITAFVVFLGTSTRGDVLRKSWQRVLGTAAGVPVGIGVALLIGGDVPVALVLIALCLFLGFYLVRLSSAFMIFWITVMLGLLYGLLGTFSPGLLGLRLEETALGAIVGGLVAVLVLPRRTRPAVGEALRGFLDSLTGVIRASVAAGSGAPDGDPVVAGRELHAKLEAVRDAATPLSTGVVGIGASSEVRRMLRALDRADHHARVLARRTQLAPTPDGERATLAEAGDHATGTVDALRAALDDGRPAVAALASELDYPASDPESPPTGRDAIAAVLRLDQVLVDLVRDLGATQPSR